MESVAVVEVKDEGGQIERAAPDGGEGLIAIVPHGIAFAGVEGVAVEEVDDALEQVVGDCGDEEGAQGEEDG